MGHPTLDTVDWYENQLKTLIGGEIVDTCVDEDFFGLVIQKDGQEYALWFLGDDEGNYGGSFELNLEEED